MPPVSRKQQRFMRGCQDQTFRAKSRKKCPSKAVAKEFSGKVQKKARTSRA